MTKKALGRPHLEKSTLSRDQILKEALRILEKEGVQGLSYRKLAKVFDVTAMALKHHVGSRSDLLKGLVQIAFEDVNVIEDSKDSKKIIRELSGNYCKCVLNHPNLSLLVLGDHSLMNSELFTMFNTIREHAGLLAKNPGEGNLVADVIIDYTHGFVLAAASQNEKTDLGEIGIQDFYKGLDWLLMKL